jgi:hypothetical protein
MKKLLLTAISAFGLATISMAQVPSYVPTSGLIGWWPFTGNANDNSVNLNNGTVYGATLTTDRYGNPSCAYSFNGLTNSITATPSTLPLGSAPRSVHAWFNTTSGAIPTSQYPNFQAITGYGNPTSGAVIFCQFVLAPTGRSYFESGSSQNQIYSASPVNDGVWHNIVTTYGGPGTRVKMYIDGVINDSTAVVTLGTPSSLFGIGNNTQANIPFQGKIDDVGMWNRALTATEVCQLYNNPSFNIIASSSTICIGQSVILTASTTATSYTWNTGATTMSIYVSPTVTSTYTVSVSNAAGCGVASSTIMVTVSPCTGINEVLANSISVYPSPTSGLINVILTSELSKNSTIEVYDAVGKLVVKQVLASEANAINISNLTNGIYTFKVLNNSNLIKTGKLIKQ